MPEYYVAVVKRKLRRTSKPEMLEIMQKSVDVEQFAGKSRLKVTSLLHREPFSLSAQGRLTIPPKTKQDCQNITWPVEICKLQ